MLTTTPSESPDPPAAAGSTVAAPCDDADQPADVRCAESVDFLELVRELQSPLLRYARRLLGPGDDAEDIVQDAFVRYHRQTDQPDNPKSWLYRVVHNRAMDLRRKRKRRKDHHGRVSDQAAAVARDRRADDQPDSGLIRAEAIAQALDCLNELPDEQQQIVTLKIMQGLTLREVAEVMDMPFPNVNYRLNRAMGELARRLKRKGVV
jgi:RNA polymerase sigma-70 factor (ECF subfamily)